MTALCITGKLVRTEGPCRHPQKLQFCPLTAGMDVHKCTDPKFRKQWIEAQLQYIRENHLDGVNLDMEPVISKDQVELRDAMASLMEELYEAVKTLNPQVGTERCYGFSDGGTLRL